MLVGGKHLMPPARSAKATSRPTILFAAVFIVTAGLLAYANSYFGAFVFDGTHFVENNLAFRKLWPPWAPMIDTARPIAALTFAVNYALGGTSTWGYHVVNLAIHIAAALVLFGVVRRTLLSGRLAARFTTSAHGLALAVALLWLVHPLQTQSVTYIYQRYESLMGLFVLLTLYGFIRAQDAPRPNRWYAVSVTCCLLAMATKEVAAVAPLLVLWYDRAMVASSWREIVRRRGAYYAGLAATWPILAGLMLSQAHKFAMGGVLVVKNLTPLQYAASQPGVIAHYLRLCFWPTDLCLDYGWPVADTIAAIVPPLVFIAALLAITIWAMFRRPEWSFLGAWFFLILAPTSSVFPIRDLAFEHRMYLPLAAVVAGVVVGGHLVGRQFMGRGKISPAALQITGISVVILIATALGILTFQRNVDYQSNYSIWADTAAKAPRNVRAHFSLGAILATAGKVDEAIDHYHTALDIDPDDAETHNNFGLALAGRGQLNEAIAHFRKAVDAVPDYADAHVNLGVVLMSSGQTDAAIAEYKKALETSPDNIKAHTDLGVALARKGQFDEALFHSRKAAEIGPDMPDVRYNLGNALARLGHTDEAIIEFQKATDLNPGYAEAHNNLGIALAGRGRLAEAVPHFRQALLLKPDFAEARKNLAMALGQE
jgi:protein O-mannosyl-transferase